MREWWTASDETTLLGDTTSGGEVTLLPVRFQRVPICILNWTPWCIQIHNWSYVRSDMTCAKIALCRTFRVAIIGSVGVSLQLHSHNTKRNTTPNCIHIARFRVFSALFLKNKLFCEMGLHLFVGNSKRCEET